jgi:hypothetical protein
MKIRFVILAVVLLSATSCSTIYIPNAANVPLISTKGEVQASVLTGTSHLDFQGAYGLTDKIALMANTSFASRNRNVLDSAKMHVHNLGELACGYYNKVGRSGRLEVYGGLGYGDTKDYDQGNTSSWQNVNGRYGKFFIQPNIGATSDIFDGAMSLRACFVKYFDFNYGGTNYKAQKSIFIEPVLTGKIGYKNVKFITQIGFSFPVLASASDLVTFDPFILNIGLNIKLNTIKSKPIVK